jgi:uncharacterized protein (DUF2235 family)
MAKKLAIFCDGTWNDLSINNATNVVRLAKSVAAMADGGTPQIVYYDEGVGVGSNVSWIVDKATKYIGGALGRGLDRKIEAAYRFLVLNYEPGDDIYIFGFSRGAYTARSLCGMIRKCGILTRSKLSMVPEAVKLYRDRDLHPTRPEMVEFRAKHAHPLAAGTEDNARLSVAPAPEVLREGARLADIYQYRPDQSYRIMYLGVWDTVGTLGVPARFDLFRWNRRYKFHDTDASTLLASIRHAVAANERREFYDTTPVTNIDELNGKWAEGTRWNVTDRASALYVPYSYRPYQQLWFPGDHCSVGGSHASATLSSAALLWIAEGAQRAGLAFRTGPDTELDAATAASDPLGDLGSDARLTNPEGKVRATGPAHADEVSESLARRWELDSRYRPANIGVLHGVDLPRPAPKLPPEFPTD